MLNFIVRNPNGDVLHEMNINDISEAPKVLKNLAREKYSITRTDPAEGELPNINWVCLVLGRIFQQPAQLVECSGDRGEEFREFLEVCDRLAEINTLTSRRDSLMVNLLSKGTMSRFEAAEITDLTYQRVSQIARGD